MKSTLILLPTLFLMACVPTKTVEPSSTSGNINISAPYLWSTAAFPRNLRISNDFPSEEVTNIQAMTTAWETTVENKMNFFNNVDRTAEVSSPTLNLDSLGNDSINGIYRIIHWPLELSGSALAVTQLFGRRYNIGSSNEYVRIEHADILINENLYNFRTGDAFVSGTYDLRTVVLHELGHFLGLGHKFGSTVMAPSVGESSTNREPTSVDKTDIASKYSIPVTTSGSSAMAVNKPQNYSPAPGDPGQKVRIMMELLSNGECVHKENGTEVQRHSVKIH